jgi:hypothetical protein
MTPSIGRIVHYTLTQHDADAINKRRADFATHVRLEEYADTGYVAHFGNTVRAGDVYPAFVIRVWPDDLINAQVLLDGTDALWITSRREGDTQGTWSWPPRV